MTNFIVFKASPWDSATVLGVYDTRGRADAAIQADGNPTGRAVYAIETVEVNAAPKRVIPHFARIS